jgi:hypothetical protein
MRLCAASVNSHGGNEIIVLRVQKDDSGTQFAAGRLVEIDLNQDDFKRPPSLESVVVCFGENTGRNAGSVAERTTRLPVRDAGQISESRVPST